MTDQKIDPSGLEFVFETGLKKIEGHERLVDALDLKMSILIALFGALITGVLAGVFTVDLCKALQLTSNITRIIFVFSLGCFVVGLYSSFQAFRTRQYYLGTRFQDMVQYAAEPASEIQEAFIPTLSKAVEQNEALLAKKQVHAKRAIWSVFLLLIGVVAAILEICTRVFMG